MKTDQVFEISGLRSLLAVLLNSTMIKEKSQTGRQNQEGKTPGSALYYRGTSYSPPTALSTRRLSARPLALLLSAVGLSSPYHMGATRNGSMSKCSSR